VETVLKNVFTAGVKDEEQTKTDLLRLVREFGNYISPGTEDDYRDALFREYREFAAKRGQM
jgi:hypothetical protein